MIQLTVTVVILDIIVSIIIDIIVIVVIVIMIIHLCQPFSQQIVAIPLLSNMLHHPVITIVLVHEQPLILFSIYLA